MPRLSIGQVPAHIALRHNAMAVTAKFRPLGSQNMERLRKSMSLRDRQVVQNQDRGMVLVSELRGVLARTDLGKYHADTSRDEVVADPYLVYYEASSDTIQFLCIKAVSPEKIKVGSTAAIRIVTHTDEGAMVLPDETLVLWMPKDA